MKKKIFILLCFVFAVATVGTYAMVQFAEENAEREMSKFDQMVAVMNETIEDEAEFNIALVNYRYLEYGYKVSAEAMDYLADLIVEGYDIDAVLDAAYFWIDTSEDVSIVKEMCEWRKNKPRYDERFWAESAFNSVTNNKYGVLTEEDFAEYRKRGISTEKILIANRLSRMGVYTIQDILSKYEEGSSMADIALEIEEQKSWTEKTTITSTYDTMNDEADYPQAKDSKLFESRELAALKNAPEHAYYDTTDEASDIETELREALDIVIETIVDDLKAENYFRNREEKGATENE